MLVARRPAGPEWKPVMGARVLFAPIDRAMLRRARKAALKALSRDEHEGAEQADAAEQLEELGDALSFALLTEGVQGWEDVCLMADDQDAGAGELLPFSAENLAMVLADPITFEAFDAAYVVPFAARERAKNGSAASPSGTGEAGMQANGTASSPATPAAPADAPSVPTAAKRPSTKKRKALGKS